jgi:urease accessory protein
MAQDAKRMRGTRPFVFTNLRTGDGLEAVVSFIREQGMLDEVRP